MAYLEEIDKKRVIGTYSKPCCINPSCRQASGAVQSILGGQVRIERNSDGRPEVSKGGFFIYVDWDGQPQSENFTIEGFKRRCQIIRKDISPFEAPNLSPSSKAQGAATQPIEKGRKKKPSTNTSPLAKGGVKKKGKK
jgi:hypothetical protein